MKTILDRKSGRTFLPPEFLLGHELCFLIHDSLAVLLSSAEQQGIFRERFQFRDEADRKAFEDASDVFAWFESTGRTEEQAAFFRKTLFPALLSDFLHFVYEALETSRKAKLAVTYALLRKPLQENLFLLEVIASDHRSFAGKFITNPLLLRSQKAGGVNAHTKRIAELLTTLDPTRRFDAAYIAQLRYDKNAVDSFDGVCNTATHLITEHPAIRTENMNLNFVFSGWQAKLTQWAYLYSRLPYVLSYARSIIEHLFAMFQSSDPVYMADIDRRLSAATVLWDETVTAPHRNPALARFSESVGIALEQECRRAGWGQPTRSELERMRADGAWPGENSIAVKLRNARHSALARLGRLLARRWS